MADREFPNKFYKKLKEVPDFLDNINSMDSEEIKKKILECESTIFEIEKSVDADIELTQTKQKAKELSKPYKENKGVETAKLKYCLHILESRGVNL